MQSARCQPRTKGMNTALAGRVAIVTGASAGIGRAYALALAGAGATVVAAARTLDPSDTEPPARHTLNEVVKAGEGLPGRIYAYVCDMEVETDIIRMIGEAVVNFGRIDVLVNNAAVMKAGEGLPGRIYAYVCDMEVETDIIRMIGEAVVNFGRIDVLVNNAAVMGGF